LLADEHVRIETTFLGHVAEATSLRLTYDRAVPRDGARVQIRETEDRPHGGRLAGAVRSQKAHDLTSGDVEGKIVEGRQGSKVTAKSLYVEEMLHLAKDIDSEGSGLSPEVP